MGKAARQYPTKQRIRLFGGSWYHILVFNSLLTPTGALSSTHRFLHSPIPSHPRLPPAPVSHSVPSSYPHPFLQSPFIPFSAVPSFIPFFTVPFPHPFLHSPLTSSFSIQSPPPPSLSPQSPPLIPFSTVPLIPFYTVPSSLHLPILFSTVPSPHRFLHSPLPSSLFPHSPLSSSLLTQSAPTPPAHPPFLLFLPSAARLSI